MAELDPENRRTLLLRAAGLALLYAGTAVAMGLGLYLLVQVFNGSFQYLQIPRSQPARGGGLQAPR